MREIKTAFDDSLEIAPEQMPADDVALRAMHISLKDKQICFVVPAGAKIDAYALDLPGGMLVLGALRGRVSCASGSIVIAAGGEFQGSAEAEDFFIEGNVTSSGTDPSGLTKLRARGKPSRQEDGVSRVAGGLIAVSANACIHAHLQARFFHIPMHADLKRSVMETL